MARELNTCQRITLQEYGDYVNLDVSQAEVNEILKQGDSWKSSLKLRRTPFVVRQDAAGVYQLRVEGIAGMVRIGNIDFEIAPKFLNAGESDWQIAFWKILSIAIGGIIDDHQLKASSSSNQALVDLFAQSFMKSFARGSLRGLPQGYTTVQNSSPTPRGSFDLSQIEQFVSRPWIYPGLVDTLTMDTPFASLIRWAANRLSVMVDSSSMARNMRFISGTLSYVKTPVPHIVDARRIKLSAQYRGLEESLKIALMLLEGSGMSYSPGEKALSGFLWNSDVVFENFMFWVCSQCAKKHQLKTSKRPYLFGEAVFGSGQKLRTIPDVVFKDSSDKVIAIADAKYKTYNGHPVNSDVYQVLSDAHILGTQKVSLLYPVKESTSRNTWLIESKLGAEPVYLTMLPINLMDIAHKDGFDELISCISEWLIWDQEKAGHD